MQDFQLRVLEEKADLDSKIGRLTSFLQSKIFEGLPVEDRDLLLSQHSVMIDYAEILRRRIARFGDTQATSERRGR